LIDVNARNMGQASPFYIACQENYVKVAALLLADERVDINAKDIHGLTPFFKACQKGLKDMVSLLLADPRINVTISTIKATTPFNIACEKGYYEVVSLLVNHPQVDINKPNGQTITPLWFASQNGFLIIVQLILASERHVDTQTKTVAGHAAWNNKTAAEHALFQETRTKDEGESEEEHQRMKQNGPLIAALLDSFDVDPVTTRQQLRELPGIRDSFISDLFSLVIFLCDDLVSVRAESSTTSTSTTKKIARFFKISQSLPMELQMVLCHRVFGAGKNIVLTKHSEPAFKKLGKLLAMSDSH